MTRSLSRDNAKQEDVVEETTTRVRRRSVSSQKQQKKAASYGDREGQQRRRKSPSRTTGQPQQTTGKAPETESPWIPAGIGRRIMAILLEFLIIVGVYVGALMMMDGTVSLALFVGVITVELCLFAKGTRIGKYCLGIYVLNTKTQNPAGFIRTFSRESIVIVSLVLDPLLWCLLRRRLCDCLLHTGIVEHAHKDEKKS